MSHILKLIEEREKEVSMSKARIVQKPREVAQIVVWSGMVHNVVRYTDMRAAKKQFDVLAKAYKKGAGGDPVVLTGAGSTAVITRPDHMDSFHLVDVESNNELMADTQRRMNAMMALP